MKRFCLILLVCAFCASLLMVSAAAFTIIELDPEEVLSDAIKEQAAALDPTTGAALSTLTGITVIVNGEIVVWTDAAPFIDANDRTMVPLRAVADAMELDVNWDAVAREAVFTGGGKTIYFPIDSSTARTSDGGTVTMDTAAVIVNDRTYAPIRYLAEYFGYSVDWNAEARAVIITG